MTQKEKLLYTVFLLKKNLKKATVLNYLSAIKFHQMSRGVANPADNSNLALQLVAGANNQARDPQADSANRERRPITAAMLRLIGHSIASNKNWNEYEKGLRWTVCLMAYWGAFRLGELLVEARHEFNPKCCLLPSDIQFESECVAIWLRNPKVTSRLGDIVEVWKVEQCPYLDPVLALKYFLLKRENTFSRDDSLPVFVHEDGTNLSKSEMNKDLKQILSLYPELAESERDKWSGHSFRSGLSTMLQSLNFTKVVCLIYLQMIVSILSGRNPI